MPVSILLNLLLYKLFNSFDAPISIRHLDLPCCIYFENVRFRYALLLLDLFFNLLSLLCSEVAWHKRRDIEV